MFSLLFVPSLKSFNISLDAFIKYRIDTLSELQLSQIEKGHDVDVTGQKLRLLTISLDKDGDENIEMVPVKAQAGYTTSYGDLDFIADLPKFNLPFLPKDKTYRTFQVKGESMLPIKEGAWVTCSYLLNWNDVKDGKAYIVVTKNDGVVFKLIYKQDEEGRFLLVSSNPEYTPYEIAIEDIQEIWKFETVNNFELE